MTTGSKTLVVGTEEMAPGERIPVHNHLQEGEVVYVLKGVLPATLGDRHYEAGTGATVNISRRTGLGSKMLAVSRP